MSDRGIKKWAPYKSLKEQWSTLDNTFSEKVEKPKISNEKADEINEKLVNYHGQEVIITHYRSQKIVTIQCVIKKIDVYNKKLVLDDKTNILFANLLEIDDIDD